MENIGD
jgi:hypothetical protein